ncbi:alpha-glucosidase [Christiangramia fulva]|uniref:Alpha-glucosidase n=1 Tax=Christiangramia fulva TaxID=2126553 RepID=A0A2R3Z7N2_9FLAO|nr:glycoside hydrolase family 97 protein [Christiangramia fulva]AVR46235.1 alpha-glucosidase [Christiangramia fulva]
MRKSAICILVLLFSVAIQAQKKPAKMVNTDNNIRVRLVQNNAGIPTISSFYKDEQVLENSDLGLQLENSNLSTELQFLNIMGPVKIHEEYSMLQGKKKNITYEANQYLASYSNKKGDTLQLIFNLSKDGLAFRYFLPNHTGETRKIEEEKTQYSFPKGAKAWVQPMSKAKTGWENTNPSYEEHYQMEIPVDQESPIGEGWVYPALVHIKNYWILISESDLHRDYAGTHLQNTGRKNSLQVVFPQKEEVFPGGVLKPHSSKDWYSPWRILAIGDLKTITESTLGTDVATPAKYTNTDFIESGLASWSWVLLKDNFTTFETSRRFIDYASRMDWKYCLIDADWDQKIGYEKMKELVEYGKKRDVKILVWYNSSGSWNGTPYTPKGKLLTKELREKEFNKLNDIGVAGIKVDFFGGDGQSMIAYYHDIMEDAYAHKLLVNFHGATLPRGWERTYPNLMSMESIKGEEFITFEQQNADREPSHAAIIPFTRNVFDPMDFTPMVLDSIPGMTRKTSKAFELALPTLFLSGIQHIAEIPEGMAKQPQYVIDYMRNIPTNWDESRFVSGFPGKDIVMARRKGETWFVTGINGEDIPKEVELDLSFLNGKKGILITDDDKKGFKKEEITATDTFSVSMIPHGGFVMKFE